MGLASAPYSHHYHRQLPESHVQPSGSLVKFHTQKPEGDTVWTITPYCWLPNYVDVYYDRIAQVRSMKLDKDDLKARPRTPFRSGCLPSQHVVSIRGKHVHPEACTEGAIHRLDTVSREQVWSSTFVFMYLSPYRCSAFGPA